MRVNNPERKSKNIFIVIILGLSLPVMLYAIFYHRGTGVIQETWKEGSILYAQMWDGHVYEASRCMGELNQLPGNQLQFTAIGVELSLFGKQISAPAIIHCEYTGAWIDYMELLPEP